MTSFNKKKEEAQALLDMEARETALKKLGIEDRFEFADHAKIYNAAPGRFRSAPVEMVSIPTGYISNITQAPPHSSDFDGSCASDGDAPSLTPEQVSSRLRTKERARAENMLPVRKLVKAGMRDDGLRLRRAKSILAAALRRPE
jgi:hypothetical protein